MATILQTLLDIGQVRLQPGLPRDLLQLVETASPLPNCFDPHRMN